MSKTKEPEKNTEKATNRDAELLKVQILADFYHTRLNVGFTSIAAVIFALVIAFTTLFYERYIDIIPFLATVIGSAILFLFGTSTLNKWYSRDLDKLDNLIKRIEKDEALPSLGELKENL